MGKELRLCRFASRCALLRYASFIWTFKLYIISLTDLHTILLIIPLTLMGVLAPGSAHAGPSAHPPIDVSGNFPRTCLQNHLQTSSPTPQKSYLKFQNSTTSLSRIYLKSANFLVKTGLIGREGGFPPEFFDCNLPIYVTWEPMQIFRII